MREESKAFYQIWCDVDIDEERLIFDTYKDANCFLQDLPIYDWFNCDTEEAISDGIIGIVKHKISESFKFTNMFDFTLDKHCNQYSGILSMPLEIKTVNFSLDDSINSMIDTIEDIKKDANEIIITLKRISNEKEK